MNAAIKTLFTEFFLFNCYKCAIPFYLTESKYNRCNRTGDNFYCPNGHPQVFTNNKIKELENKLTQEKRRREWAENDIQHKRKNSVNSVLIAAFISFFLYS